MALRDGLGKYPCFFRRVLRRVGFVGLGDLFFGRGNLALEPLAIEQGISDDSRLWHRIAGELAHVELRKFGFCGRSTSARDSRWYKCDLSAPFLEQQLGVRRNQAG